MTERRIVSSGGPWEARVGYSRAVRAGRHVRVAGSTAMTPAGLIGAGDPYLQTRQALQPVERALVEAGASLADVVRTRIQLNDLDRLPEVARAHAEAFATVQPAASMVEVRRLIDPEMLVEIEANAFVTR